MAENGSTMMDDIILSMINEDNGDDDSITRARSDSDIITADEFRQLFSHSFVCIFYNRFILCYISILVSSNFVLISSLKHKKRKKKRKKHRKRKRKNQLISNNFK